jgi:hypothetical protein
MEFVEMNACGVASIRDVWLRLWGEGYGYGYKLYLLEELRANCYGRRIWAYTGGKVFEKSLPSGNDGNKETDKGLF